jgi:N-acetylglutamate synthase-like GNAT family acetyltransferase
MTSTLQIREFTSEYQSQVVELILHIQQREYGIPITIDDQPDLLRIESFYQEGDGNFWTALNGKKVAGTLALKDIGNQQVALRKMFVDAEYRGRPNKTGERLLNHAIEWAGKKGISEIYLGTTLQFVAAHRFYEKNGFASIEKQDLPENFPVMGVDKKFYKLSI